MHMIWKRLTLVSIALLASRSSTSNISNEDDVAKEIEEANKLLDNLLQENSSDKKILAEGKLRGFMETILKENSRRIQQYSRIGKLEEKLKLAEEWAWFELMRQQIEYFEDNNFPQPSDDDYESKKVLWNNERFKGKSRFELSEERRYQKFKYYLENPPNEAVQKLRNRLDIGNVSVDVFCRGVAKAYRLISARIHDGYIKWLHMNIDDMFLQEDVLIAMRILLDEMGISRKLIKKIENTASRTKNETELIVNNFQKQ